MFTKSPNRLRELRKARGLTQQELGDATNIGQRDIGHYERSSTKIGPERLLRLASFLGVEIGDIADIETTIAKTIKVAGLPRDCRECRHLKAVGIFANAGWGCDVLGNVREDCDVFAMEHPNLMAILTSRKTL